MALLDTLRFIAGHPLNRERKLRSIVDFARWQVRSRMSAGPIVHDWVHGSKFLVKNGDTGLTGNIYAGLHEFPDMGYLLHVLRAEDLFVDVGANVGSYTLLACAAIAARGVAFEPVPETFGRLEANVRLNELEERVRCVNMGLGGEPGSLAFTTASDTTNHALADGEERADCVQVEVTTLDKALEGEEPALMKIDVEGYETLVLAGAEETLRKPSLHSVIMELNGSGVRYGFDESRLLELMLDLGFKTYGYDPFERALIHLDGKNHESGNTLFVRDELHVLDRIRSAPMISVHGEHF